MLVYNTEPVICEAVNVELKGKTSHYLYKNEADGVQGNIWLNGTPLFGYGGAEEIDTANTMIRKTAAVSQPFADWLTENGWNQYVE